MFSKFCSFLIVSIAVQYSYAQSTQADSLHDILQKTSDKQQQVKIYRALTDLYVVKDFDACLAAALSGTALAERTGNLVDLGYLQKQAGLAHYFKGNYDSAASYYYKAIDNLNKASAIEEKVDVLNVLARLYRKTRDLDRALQIYDEAYAIHKKRNNLGGMATILNESGVVFEYKGDYKEAINRYSQSLAICERTNDLPGKAYSINFIGGAYTLEKKFVEAERYLLRSLDLRKQLKDTFGIALNHADLGYMYMEKGSFDNATRQYDTAIHIAYKMKYPDLLLSSYRELSTIAEKKGDLSLSLEYYKKHTALKDSIYTGDKMKQIEEMNAKYQAEKKEQQLQLQKATIAKKNYLLWGLGISILLLAVAGFAFYRKKQWKNKVELQAEVMKQQDMATKAILEAEENERKRIAADLHDGVGQMMSAAKMNLSAYETDLPFKDAEQRTAFEKIISLVDESCKEIRSVSHQMMPNALLKNGLANAVKEFIDKIDHRVLKVSLHAEGLNERLDSNTETVLYRVIQECVNNVIKHSGASQLDISLIKDSDGIAATIEDNGHGFDASDKKKFEGIGLKNITTRIAFLKGTVEFDTMPGKGTLVAIHVPLA